MQTIFAETALLASGWARDVRVSIDGQGRIAAVEAGASRDGGETVTTLLPALCNLHSHTFQRAMAGLAETRAPTGRDSFWTWREIMYRFLDILSPDDIESIAAFAFMEMQEAGFPAVAEFHYLHHRTGGGAYDDAGELSGRIAAAASRTGIGLTLLPVLYRHGGVDGRMLKGGQLRFGNDIDHFGKLAERAQAIVADLPPDAVTGIAPHSLRAVGQADIGRAMEILPTAPFHMHIAEQEAEIEETIKAYGARPVEWLLDSFHVDRRWCLIHCTHMHPGETKRLATSGAVAGLCPVTEANLGDGIFDGARFAEEDGRFGIGTDSNIRISVAEELRQLEYAQRLRDRARVVLARAGQSAGRRLYETALAGGAQALGRETGAIAAGNWADMVAIDAARFAGAGKGDRLLDGWAFTGGNDAVTDLWSAGRHMVSDGRHIHRDAIAQSYRTTLDRLMEKL